MEDFRNSGSGKENVKEKPNSKGTDRHCDHCGVNGHIRDTRFKLHGYPDWYKDLKNKKSNTISRFLLTLRYSIQQGSRLYDWQDF